MTSLRFLLILLVLVVPACSDSDVSMPTAPTGALIVDSFQTSTQIETQGFRIQVRANVVSGLDALRTAARTGRASTEVCESGLCEIMDMISGHREGDCSLIPAGTFQTSSFSVASSFLDADIVGVDFCVDDLVAQRAYGIRFGDGSDWSNTITMRCTQSNAGLVCGAG